MDSIIMNFDDSTEINVVYNQLKKQYPKVKISKANINEMLENEYLLALAIEREKNGNGITWSSEDIMKEFGITQQEIDAMEDVELDYEI